MKVLSLCVLLMIAVCSASVYFQEDFNGWEDRWVQSSWKKDSGEAGDFVLSAGKYFNDEDADVGLQTSEDARFYAYSVGFEDFSNEDKDLVLQYRIKNEQSLSCGGGYIKVLPSGIDQENFKGDTDYNIMFGPDICGSSTKRVHVIFNYKGENYLIKKTIPCETDTLSHLYTLILRPDNTFTVKIDNEIKAEGSLEEDFDILPPKTIPDPEQSKPEDWVDESMIADPEDVKPEDWDEQPREIPDPEAEKPEEWDDDLDGEWEAPTVPNPEWNGEWTPTMIPNPEYVGEWEHPLVENPDYFTDDKLYVYESNAFIGIEVWQVNAGTIFSDFLVTDSVEEAEAAAEEFLKLQEGEKQMKEEADAEAAAAAAAAAAEAEAEAEDVEDDIVEDEHEDL